MGRPVAISASMTTGTVNATPRLPPEMRASNVAPTHLKHLEDSNEWSLLGYTRHFHNLKISAAVFRSRD